MNRTLRWVIIIPPAMYGFPVRLQASTAHCKPGFSRARRGYTTTCRIPAISDPQVYTVGWICAIPTELAAARTFLDEHHPAPKTVQRNDNNTYTLGKMGEHNVVIAVMPKREYGIAAAATVARDLAHSFPNIRIGLMVGVGGGAPSYRHDIRLGDIVIGTRDAGKGGVIQYDYGKAIQNQAFVETGSLNQPPQVLLNAVAGLETEYMMQGPELDSKVQAALVRWKRLQKTHSRPAASTDRLYKSDFIHPLDSSAACSQACHANAANIVSRHDRRKDEDNPAIHYGLIGSANQVMKNAEIRDKISAEKGILCFEMEAAGLMNHFPCLVIRGICDYSDSHKNKEWQGFAAMVAAAYAKDLLLQIPPNGIKTEKPVLEVLSSVQQDIRQLNQAANETKTAVQTMQSDQTVLLVDLQRGVQDLKLGKAEDPSIARNPHFLVPFPSDPDFVDRSDIWTWMERQYAGPESRFALVGLGGFGYVALAAVRDLHLHSSSKSQMAIRFAHEVHATSPKTSIFWVHGRTKAAFEESYRSIADVLALPRRHDPNINVLALVCDWLQREDVSPWLMIVDNADDFEMLFSKNSSENGVRIPTVLYLPKTNNGKILFTSRSWDAAEKLTGNGKTVHQVPTMEQAQALLLLQKKLGHDVDEDAALRLVEALEYIPLAINQAAAYINKRSPRVAIQSYLDEFQKSEKRKGTLLRSDRGDIRRYEGVSNSVLVTWQVTFEQIKREQPRAANLLSLMSYFHAQNIPEYMLHDYNSRFTDTEGNDDDDDEISDNGDFEDDLDVLRGYSLITMTAMSGFCEMHSLVQFCTKVWISEFGCPDRWKNLFLQSASRHFPSGVFETWEQCQMLMPHVQPLLNKEPPAESDRLKWSELLTNASRYLRMLGDYSRAEGFIQEAVRIRTESLGEKHPSTLMSMDNLASTFWNQGRWKEAEELGVRVMETRKRVLGEEHRDTITSMANLALTFCDRGRWKEAEELGVRVVEMRKRLLGEEHPSTLTSMANLASTFWNQGRWKEAEELGVRVVEMRKRVLKEEHPHTLMSMGNLALTYRNQGRWKEAEELQTKELDICLKVLGEEHPSTLTSMSNLASTYKSQGRLKEAEELGVRVMETSLRVLGEEHPLTLTSMGNLALTYSYQGRWKEAEELEVRVIEMSSTVLGKEHPDTLTSMANLASTFGNQGRWKEAEELEVRVMETRKRVLGEEHPDTLTSMHNLAFTWKDQERWKDATQLLQDCVRRRENVLGVDHPDTLSSASALSDWKPEFSENGYTFP
ncbi:Kinesin light chain 5 [Colletotrichum chrysophilum]|uniref:Kinesin light chain 5 n=1 Tax=Colletotrichum chrysophilum TaxID=1836956 RepID=A0AAD8ZZ92_9PEZI|nr:Kinesin light chain 5 [Colletotrichum chrysophilum]